MGSVAILLILISQSLLLSVTGIELKNSIADLGSSAGSVLTNPMLIVVTFISMIMTGGIIMAIALIRTKIAKHFGMTPQTIKFNTSRKLGLVLSLFVIGLLTSLIFGGFNDFIQNASPDADLNSLQGFLGAITSGNIGLILAIFFTIAVFGALANVIGHLWKPVNAGVERATHNK
jgi:hypothetical protein